MLAEVPPHAEDVLPLPTDVQRFFAAHSFQELSLPDALAALQASVEMEGGGRDSATS